MNRSHYKIKLTVLSNGSDLFHIEVKLERGSVLEEVACLKKGHAANKNFLTAINLHTMALNI